MKSWPEIIQGGMGVGVSNWRLARAVSLTGQLGTVSLVAIPHVVARRLQQGDKDMDRALSAFPVREVARDIRQKYWKRPQVAIPMFSLHPSSQLVWLTLFASFAEVWLAKEGHRGMVAGNLLEKVQLPTMCTMLGAMWAGIDAFIIGAGLPTQIPEVLDALCAGRPARYRVSVLGGTGESREMVFDLEALLNRVTPESRRAIRNIAISRPAFFPIVSLDVTAGILWKKMDGQCDGFIVEHPVVAGGHNPSPRGWKDQLNSDGEPIYTDRDVADYVKMPRKDGSVVPFWVAGGVAHPKMLGEAKRLGATGIQCGSIFALASESGITPSIKRELIRLAYRNELWVLSDPRASPTGFPFQVVSMPGTVSEQAVYEGRRRICNLGYLRMPCVTSDGNISYRCPAEPSDNYHHKGGTIADTVGRKCLCNNLLAQIGLGLAPNKMPEPPIITLGKDTGFVRELIDHEDGTYTASQVIAYLLGRA